MDLKTDQALQETIHTQFKESTMIIIAHRLDTILTSDKILVLEKGKAVEFDKPKNLLNDPHSHFYKMCQKAGIVERLWNEKPAMSLLR